MPLKLHDRNDLKMSGAVLNVPLEGFVNTSHFVVIEAI
jgi:hypothetical protein